LAIIDLPRRLFDLDFDLFEQNDLAKKHSEPVEELARLWGLSLRIWRIESVDSKHWDFMPVCGIGALRLIGICFLKEFLSVRRSCPVLRARRY